MKSNRETRFIRKVILDNDTIIYLNLTYEMKKSEDFNNLNNNLNLPWDFENNPTSYNTESKANLT